MPLSELVYRVAKGKLDSSQEKNPTCSTDPSFFRPENDFVELLWENGQIHSTRARKIPTCDTLPSQSPRITRDNGIGNGTNTKVGKLGVMESAVNEMPMSASSAEMGLSQDDDLVPWLNYPVDESVQRDYCSEFLPELSGAPGNEFSSQNNFTLFEKRSGGNQLLRNSNGVSVDYGLSLEEGNVSKVSSVRHVEATRLRTSAAQSYQSLPMQQQCQTLTPFFRSRVLANDDDIMRISTHNAVSRDPIRIQTSEPSSSNSNLMNFSHFSRPAALVKANLQSISMRAGSGIWSLERAENKVEGSVATDSTPIGVKAGSDVSNLERIGSKSSVASCSTPSESILIGPYGGLQKEAMPHCHSVVLSSTVDAKSLDFEPTEETHLAEIPEVVSQEDDSKNDKNSSQNFGENTSKRLGDGEKTLEPIVASSSVCSGNSVERASGDPIKMLKRKHQDAEESEGPSEDIEEESVGAKRAAPARGGTGCKRSRAAEVHNLSERRRRDRINEKMRALQELIPNCNKVDKASMLDEAIEYLKTLQLQVQIMSMGAGLYMPSMMLAPGMPHMHAAHMTQFSPMGVGLGMGMGMGFGMGMPDMNGVPSGCSMIQMPPTHGAHFPGLPMSGPSALHGLGSNVPMFGLSGQGLSMPFPCSPLIPIGAPILRPTMGLNSSGVPGHVGNVDSARGSSSKEAIQNNNLQMEQNSGANGSINQESDQCQALNECFEQSDMVQNNGQASEVTDKGASSSGNAVNNIPSGAGG